MKQNPFKKQEMWRFIAAIIFAVLMIFGQDKLLGEEIDNLNQESNSAAYLPVVMSPSLPSWLIYTNDYRAMANLPPVTENASWSHGNILHGRYGVKNDLLVHDEDPGNPYYTPEGRAAARSSNLTASSDINATYVYAIDSWMQAPFHALGVLDPSLHQVGYGDYQEADGVDIQMAAGLDVLRGLSSIPDTVKFPIAWPAAGKTVSLTSHWGEFPRPLSSCPGYSTPSGLPVLLQAGPGNITPNVTAHSLTKNGKIIEHCLFDETNYANPDLAQQDLGRAILDSRDAIVMIPRDPLLPGATYHVSVTVNGESHAWFFSVSDPTSVSMHDLNDAADPPGYEVGWVHRKE